MNDKSDGQQTAKPGRKQLHRLLRQIAQWTSIAIILFVFITGMYISLAAYTGQSIQFTTYESLQTPLILTGIILIIFGFAAILYSSGASKDGSWTIMTGPYVR